MNNQNRFVSTIAFVSLVALAFVGGCAKPQQPVNYPLSQQLSIQSQCDIPASHFVQDNSTVATIQGLAVDGSTWVWLEGEHAYFWMTSEENKARAKKLWENVKQTASEKYDAIQSKK